MLEAERKKASFNQMDLSYLIYDGKEGYEQFLKKQEVIDSDPVLKFDPSMLHQSREHTMEVMGKKILRIHSYHNIFPLDGSSQIDKIKFFSYQAPLSLHGLMFLKTLENLCDEEQRKVLYEPALRGEIIGCYAQTELGHGSDIQRLQTLATYDPQTQTFTINSPSISSAKWWIGDLGVHCTHAALFAQLIIANKNHGLHAFVVPVRDPQTFKPLPGVQVGDIGPKQGFNTKDNGYAIFNNLVIPRRNMLMKYHVVSKQGKYSLQGDEKISYATMLMTRSGINWISLAFYSKVVTIGVRYSLLRRQFKNSKGDQIPVLDYQTQQAKIVSRVGEVFAHLFTTKSIAALASFVFNESRNGRFHRLNEAHVLTSASKAFITFESLNNTEVLRRALGGHGFHLYSGVVGVQHEVSPSITFQGQFTILMLQVARFLFKSVVSLQKGSKLAPSVNYLQNLSKESLSLEVKEEKVKCPFFVNSILRNYACASVKKMALKLSEGLKKGMSEKEVWDTYAGISLVEGAIAHTIYTMHTYFLEGAKKIQQPNLKTVMMRLCNLYGLQKLIERASAVYETGIIGPEAFQFINKRREGLLAELRPQALSLIQAFGYSDNVLQSAIGHSNERPYENLINWARRYNTLNRPEERDQVIEAIKKAKSELKPSL